jgi:hypothetical protein
MHPESEAGAMYEELGDISKAQAVSKAQAEGKIARDAEIPGRVAALDEMIDTLSKAAGEVEIRLVSVVRSAPEESVPEGPRVAYETSLAQALDSFVYRVESIRDRLNSLRNRIEV